MGAERQRKTHRATRRMLVFGFDTIEMNEDVLVCGHCRAKSLPGLGESAGMSKWCSVPA